MKQYQSVIMVKCNGDAHSPEIAGNIDHCWSCAPYWEVYPICPICKRKVKRSGSTRSKFYCKECRKHFVKDPSKNPIDDSEIDFDSVN